MNHNILLGKILFAAFIVSILAIPAAADWDTTQVIQHEVYQAVNTDGSPAYSGGFPLKMYGVVLNNSEDWLDSTADYDSGVNLWEMGGQAEIYVQALWQSTLDLGTEYYTAGDFGGTACWMGQNYGNHWQRQDPSYNYTNAEWYAELDRLKLSRPGGSETGLVRAGDLVEIRARGGLHYKGKMNVNEQHDNSPDNDFDIIILQAGYGLPDATEISLSAIKDAGDGFIFDNAAPTRESGGELYQSTLVTIMDVTITSGVWESDSDITITDGNGRTLNVHLGLNPIFDNTSAPTGYFDITGIMDQSSSNGTDGYQLLVMVPEPVTITMLALGGLPLLLRRRK